jgi:hypothetical protein
VDRHTVQRTDGFAPRMHRVQKARAIERFLAHQVSEGVELALVAIDTRERGFGQLDG